MKFTCSRDDILKEISIAQEVISSKNSLSVLSNVLLTVGKGELKLQATDLKVGFETSLPVEITQEGTTTAFCDKLLNILRSLPEGDVELEQSDPTMLRIRPLSEEGGLPAALHPIGQVPRAGPRVGQHVLRLSPEGLHRDGVPDAVRRFGRRDPLLHERDLPGKEG